MPRPAREVRVAFSGDRRALAPVTVRRVVDHVLSREGRDDVDLTVTFLSSPRMRGLNRRTFGRDRPTDVIAFGLFHDGVTVGDVYVCPAVARRSARAGRIADREELIRLVTHGTLHVIGYDHPDGPSRADSSMWARQERYVGELLGGGP